MIEQGVGENLNTVSKRVVHRSPNKLHRFAIKTHIFILVIKSRKHTCIKAHLSKQTSVSVGVAKWINLPADSWSNIKLFKDELVAYHHVVYHVFKMGTCLIMHRPASVEKFETALLYQNSNLVFELFRLVLPPHSEEFHFYIRKAFCRVGNKFRDYCVKDQTDVCSLSAHSCT